MKKYILILVVVAMLCTACNQTIPQDTNTSDKETQPTEAPTEMPVDPTQPNILEIKETPIPDDAIIPVESEYEFAPILYCTGGEFIIIGGSFNGQWFAPSRFEAKLDGEVANPQDIEPGSKKSLEFALMRKDQLIDFYNNDACMGGGTCKSVSFIVDGYGNEIYQADLDVISSIDTPTIGLSTLWNPFPLPEQKGEMTEGKYLIDINKNDVMDTLFVAKQDKDGIMVDTLTLDMDGKSILVSEIEVDGIYCSEYYIYFLDLNGDGRLEIITAQEGHNIGVTVYDIIDSGAEAVLSCYIGD